MDSNDTNNTNDNSDENYTSDQFDTVFDELIDRTNKITSRHLALKIFTNQNIICNIAKHLTVKDRRAFSKAEPNIKENLKYFKPKSKRKKKKTNKKPNIPFLDFDNTETNHDNISNLIDLETLKPFYSICIYLSGNSTLNSNIIIKTLLNNTTSSFKNYARGFVMTEVKEKNYKDILPEHFIYDEYSHHALKTLLESQLNLINENIEPNGLFILETDLNIENEESLKLYLTEREKYKTNFYIAFENDGENSTWLKWKYFDYIIIEYSKDNLDILNKFNINVDNTIFDNHLIFLSSDNVKNIILEDKFCKIGIDSLWKFV